MQGEVDRRDEILSPHRNTYLHQRGETKPTLERATHGKDLVAAVEAACEDVDDIVTLVGVLAREDVAQQGEEGLYTTKRVSLQEVTLSEREATCLDGVGTARVVGFRFFEGSDGMDEEERDVVLFQS